MDRRDKRDTFSIKNGIYKGKGLDLGRSLPRVKQTTRFEIVKLRQGNRVERNTHAQRLEMRRILLTNDGGSVVKLAYLT